MGESTEDFLKRFGSRDHAVTFPHDMSVTAHLMREHDIPKIDVGTGTAYHYTDAAGLLGIASGNKFWATHWSFLNDPLEGVYGLEVARDALARNEGEGGRFGIVAARTKARLRELPLLDMFVVSFCRNGDLLSQWRGYGAFGSGYALGFDLATLRPHPQMGWLIEISYDDARLRHAIDVTTGIYRDHVKAHKDLDVDDLADWWSTSLRFIAETFKHPGYNEEGELRLIFRRYAEPKHDSEKPKDYEAPIRYRGHSVGGTPSNAKDEQYRNGVQGHHLRRPMMPSSCHIHVKS